VTFAIPVLFAFPLLGLGTWKPIRTSMKGSLFRLISVTIVLLLMRMRKTMALAEIQRHAMERIIPCELPKWARNRFLHEPQQGKIPLANLPTPLYRLHSNGSKTSILDRLEQKGISFYIKRDDMSGGVELGGKKIDSLSVFLIRGSLDASQCLSLA
jgi:hypothetical protein